ncbi:MAG TPA: lactonase family protein [Acidobacteriaceae bacterium]|nr:lactonase family protein [Acidobacteriaceae bacterium]
MAGYSRRQFVGRAVALPFALRGMAAAQATGRFVARGKGSCVLLGSDTGKGVYRAPWNAATGTLGAVELAGAAERPSFLAKHPSLPVVYAVNGVSGDGAAISSFQVNPTVDGLVELQPLNKVGSQGNGPCYVSVDPTGEMAFVANYGGGSFAAFRVTNVGALAQAIGVFKYTQATHGPVTDRQDAAHIHCATIAPGNRYVLACDLGDDVILVFPVGPGEGDYVRVPIRVQARAGSGPRHVAFHPNGRWVYCIHEIDCTIDVYDWSVEGGAPVMKLRENSVVSTLDKGMSTKGQTACEIVISEDARFLYSCTRGEDTITVWRIDESGYLTQMQKLSSGGKVPRYIAFDPAKKWLVCCNQGAHGDPGNVTVFSHDAATGRLGVRPKTFAATTPMFTLWV